MNKKQRESLKKLLEERQQEILQQFGASSEDIGKLQEENAADWVDRVTLDGAVSSLMSQESDLSKELERILEALENIEKNTYGICGECQKEITFERLEAVPTAKMCVDCKNKMERTQGRVFNQRGPASIPTKVLRTDD